MVPIWSAAQAGGLPLERFPGWNAGLAEALLKRTRGSGAEVIKLKGGAGFAVGLSIREVVHSVALDQKRILPVSSLVNGPYGMRDVCISVPTVVGRKGVESQLEIELWPKEVSALQHSAQVLRETIEAVFKSNPKAAGKAKPDSGRPRSAAVASGPRREPAARPGDDGRGRRQRRDRQFPGHDLRARRRGNAEAMEKSLDRKLAAIHADPDCREFIIADAKDADMALGLGAPGQSPEMHAGEVRFKTLEEYRDQMRLITRSGPGRHHAHVGQLEPCADDRASGSSTTRRSRRPSAPTTRPTSTWPGARPITSSPRGRSAPPASTTSSAATSIARPRSARSGPNLGLYSVTFNNDLERDLATLERFHEFREEAERKGFRYFLEVFDPNIPGAVKPELLPELHQRHDHADAGGRRARRAGRCSSRWSITAPRRWKSWSGSTRTWSSASWAARPARPATPSSSCTTPRNTGPRSPSSAARSTTPRTNWPSSISSG